MSIFVESSSMASVLAELEKLPNPEELYEVTGEFDIVSTFSTNEVEEFREILVNQIMKIKEVRSTVTDIVLHTHKHRTINLADVAL